MENRLRTLRLEAGLTQQGAADAMGVSIHSYIKLERGTRRLTNEYILRAAKAFGVEPGVVVAEERLAPIVGYIGADASGRVQFAEGQGTGEFVPLPPGGSELAVALHVRGSSMPDVGPDGSIVYYEDRRETPSEDMLGALVAVGLQNGEVLFKTLRRGSRKGLFDLESTGAPTLRDQQIVWFAHITAIVPPWQARRIVRES